MPKLHYKSASIIKRIQQYLSEWGRGSYTWNCVPHCSHHLHPFTCVILERSLTKKFSVCRATNSQIKTVIDLFVFNSNSISINSFKLFKKQFVFFSILSHFQKWLRSPRARFFLFWFQRETSLQAFWNSCCIFRWKKYWETLI